jgi:hypothetical protein
MIETGEVRPNRLETPEFRIVSARREQMMAELVPEQELEHAVGDLAGWGL